MSSAVVLPSLDQAVGWSFRFSAPRAARCECRMPNSVAVSDMEKALPRAKELGSAYLSGPYATIFASPARIEMPDDDVLIEQAQSDPQGLVAAYRDAWRWRTRVRAEPQALAAHPSPTVTDSMVERGARGLYRSLLDHVNHTQRQEWLKSARDCLEAGLGLDIK